MLIELQKSRDGWRADCKDLPGTPPVGIAETKERAVAMLFATLILEAHASYPRDQWITHLLRSLLKDQSVTVKEI